jgi:hypothetical protein
LLPFATIGEIVVQMRGVPIGGLASRVGCACGGSPP